MKRAHDELNEAVNNNNNNNNNVNVDMEVDEDVQDDEDDEDVDEYVQDDEDEDVQDDEDEEVNADVGVVPMARFEGIEYNHLVSPRLFDHIKHDEDNGCQKIKQAIKRHGVAVVKFLRDKHGRSVLQASVMAHSRKKCSLTKHYNDKAATRYPTTLERSCCLRTWIISLLLLEWEMEWQYQTENETPKEQGSNRNDPPPTIGPNATRLTQFALREVQNQVEMLANCDGNNILTFRACIRNEPTVMQQYLDTGNVDVNQPLEFVNSKNQIFSFTLLHCACLCGNAKMVRALAALHAEIREASIVLKCPLILACRQDNPDLLQALLTCYPDLTDPDHYSVVTHPLSHLIKHGNVDSLRIYLEHVESHEHHHGIANADDNGLFLFGCPYRDSSYEINKLLLQSGAANPNQQDDEGTCVFMRACGEDKLELATLLLQHGADIDLAQMLSSKMTEFFVVRREQT